MEQCGLAQRTAPGRPWYLKEALRCVDNFEKSPSGYRALIYGPTPLVFERPATSTQADEAYAWKYITASLGVRVQRLMDAKRRKARTLTEHTAVFLKTGASEGPETEKSLTKPLKRKEKGVPESGF